MSTQPATTLSITFFGIDADDGRFRDLIDRIDDWSEDNLGIVEPPHSFETHQVATVNQEAGGEGC